MGERIEYLRIYLRYNGYPRHILTVKDINDPDIDGYVQDNSDVWFFLDILRAFCVKEGYKEDELLDDVFPYRRP